MSQDTSRDMSQNHNNNGDFTPEEDEEWGKIQDVTKKWLKLVGKALPRDRATAEEEYLMPAKLLLERYKWDGDESWAVLRQSYDSLLANGKTPYRLSAIVPKIIGQLNMVKVEKRWNTT